MPNTLPCGRIKETIQNRDLLSARKTLENYINKNDLKFTKQRFQIADVILSFDEHLDIQSFVKKIKLKFPKISTATIYRTVKILCESGLLVESFQDSRGVQFFEKPKSHHDHIVCIDCHEIFEFHNPLIEAAQKAQAETLKFKPTSHLHVIQAKCQYLESY